ncbi:MAG: DUF4417 domain-containing protein [Anaerococcus sp.]|nr:DUF4417 domain-containing protein [Anaerococcus sp.]
MSNRKRQYKKLKCEKYKDRDVFKSFLVKNASYDGDSEIPILNGTSEIPDELVLFSKSIKLCRNNKWICFYEDDSQIERFWNTPRKYLNIIKKAKGVILPDFSLFRDMPLVQQNWNIYRSRALGTWLEEQGIKIIPNIRWADNRTYGTCCLGIKRNSTIAIGTHGILKKNEERNHFIKGLDYVIDRLSPKNIVIYGATPENIFGKYRKLGINICQFDSETSRYHQSRCC